jgi:GDP-L-fucose synthase
VKGISLLVIGGSGLVGNALQKICKDAIYVSSKDFDLTDKKETKKMFETYKPTKVIHLAAKVGGIIENMKYPADFIYQNVLINSYVIHYAKKYNVEKLIGILSNCAYPDIAKKYPMKEEQLHDDLPAPTNLAYGYSKRLLDIQVKSYRKQFGCNFFCVIPCNMYGPHDKFDEKESHFLAALIRKIHEVKIKNEKVLKLMGTGKPLRQYLYSEDLAKILLILLEKYNDEGPINVAPKGGNPSIAEIAQIALDATGSKNIMLEFDDSYPDGQYRKDISISRLLKIVGDFKFTSLSDGIKTTYDWYKRNLITLEKGRKYE